MSKRLSLLLVLILTMGVIYSFGCSDKGGGGTEPPEPPPPPPPAVMDKVVFGQKFLMAEAPPAEEVTPESIKGVGIKDYVHSGPVMVGAKKEQKYEWAFFSGNINGTNIKRLTPLSWSAVWLGMDPLGNVHTWNRLGIWVTNANAPDASALLIDSQQLFRKFSDGSEGGLYWSEPLLKAALDRVDEDGSSKLYFVTESGEEKLESPITLFILKSNVIKASDGKEITSIPLWLRYVTAETEGDDEDEATTTEPKFTHIVPAFSEAKAVLELDEETTSFINGAGALNDKSFLPYNLTISNLEKTYIYSVQYDPIEEKHYAVWRNSDWLPTEMEDIFPLAGLSCSGAKLFQKVAKLKLPEDNLTICDKEYIKSGTDPNHDIELDKAKKAVFDCLKDQLLTDQKIGLYSTAGLQKDITQYVSTKSELKGLLSLEKPAGELTKIADFDASLFYDFNEEEVTIVCEQPVPDAPEADKRKCVPTIAPDLGGEVLIELPSNPKLICGPPTYIVYASKIKEDDVLWDALYLLNLDSGESKLIDKSTDKVKILTTGGNEPINMNRVNIAETAAGPVIMYYKLKSTPNFEALFAYDVASDKITQLTNYYPDTCSYCIGDETDIYTIEPEEFSCQDSDGNMRSCNGITYDGSHAFIRLQESTDDVAIGYKYNFFVRDMSGILSTAPVEEVEGEEEVVVVDEASLGNKLSINKPKEDEVSGGEEGTETGEGEETPAVPETKKEAPLPGAEWAYAYSENKTWGIDIDFDTFKDGKGFWNDNHTGTSRLYMNDPLGNITPVLLSSSGGDEEGEGEENEEVFKGSVKGATYSVPADLIVIDPSTADVATGYACSKSGGYYCANQRDMCVKETPEAEGTCVNMYMCSEHAQRGACFGTGEVCHNGTCKTKCPIGNECEEGQTCQDTEIPEIGKVCSGTPIEPGPPPPPPAVGDTVDSINVTNAGNPWTIVITPVAGIADLDGFRCYIFSGECSDMGGSLGSDNWVPIDNPTCSIDIPGDPNAMYCIKIKPKIDGSYVEEKSQFFDHP